MTMPVEATEHAGPVVIWRKELRPDSGGAGRMRGGLGQFMQIGARDGYDFRFSGMFDRMYHPARGRDGGAPGGATEMGLTDGTQFPPKHRFDVPGGTRVHLAFPGGAGYGPPADRDPALIARDLRRGYISADLARTAHGWSDDQIARALKDA
jgi:N-methylhydantoinase B